MGQVATAVAQVAGDVAQDVGHLEGFAEADAELGHAGGVPVFQGGLAGDADGGPELADAASDAVDVGVELGCVVDGADFCGVGWG